MLLMLKCDQKWSSFDALLIHEDGMGDKTNASNGAENWSIDKTYHYYRIYNF